MCGRFSLTRGDRDLEEEFGAKVPSGHSPRYNIAPTQEVLVLLDDGLRRIEAFRWGLIPSWAKDPQIGNKLINARAETLFEKPSFRSAVKQRRCLVLADGFFEWRKTEEKSKIPIYLRLKSKRLFGFAGLWEVWTSSGSQALHTCAIVTTEANELMKSIHDRMPVIVPKELEDLWLNPKIQSEKELRPLLQPYPADEMEAFEVSRLVNSPTNDQPACVQPVKRL